jgi:hypothetical protein
MGGHRQSESSPFVLPKIHLRYRYTLLTTSLNSLVAPYGPDSLIARLPPPPPPPYHDTSPPLPFPGPSLHASDFGSPREHTHNTRAYVMVHWHRITHKEQLYDIYTSFLLVAFLQWARSAAQNDPHLFLFFFCLCLRASWFTSSSSHAQPPSSFFLLFYFIFPADSSSRSAAPRPMGVKADGCQRHRPLVDASDSGLRVSPR